MAGIMPRCGWHAQRCSGGRLTGIRCRVPVNLFDCVMLLTVRAVVVRVVRARCAIRQPPIATGPVYPSIPVPGEDPGPENAMPVSGPAADAAYLWELHAFAC